MSNQRDIEIERGGRSLASLIMLVIGVILTPILIGIPIILLSLWQMGKDGIQDLQEDSEKRWKIESNKQSTYIENHPWKKHGGLK